MKWFLNLSTRSKLFLGFGVLILLAGGVTATGYSAITELHTSQQALYQRDFANLRDLRNLRTLQNQVRAEMLEAQLVDTPAKREHLLKDAAEDSRQIGLIMAALTVCAIWSMILRTWAITA